MTRAEVTTRQQHAHAFAVAAELVSSLGHDAGMTQLGNTVASLAVLSGISAGDAICGAVLGDERPAKATQKPSTSSGVPRLAQTTQRSSNDSSTRKATPSTARC